MKHTVPSYQILPNLHMIQIFYIKYPVYQIKFVPEMIIETFSVHIAFCTDIRDGDLCKRCRFHQFFQS